jgi:hypothetical protein
MSLIVEQIFVRHSNVNAVSDSLREYVRTIGKEFRPHPKYRLDGVEQVLRILIKRSRKFILYGNKNWVIVWEALKDGGFADPEIARHLARDLRTDAIWIDFDDNYNIWAFQHFAANKLSREKFLPKCYFEGDENAEDHLDDYGSCHTVAEEFNATLNLPEFLTGIEKMQKRMEKNGKIKLIECKLPKGR